LSDKRLVVKMAAKYQLYKDKAGKFRFRLVAENGKTIATGEAYERHASCLNGIESVKKNSGSPIHDMAIDSQKIPFPKYQIFVDKAGEFRFNLSASNGEVIASSEGYSSKEGCLNGINAVQRLGNSEIEDLTTATEKQYDKPVKEPETSVTKKESESPTQPKPEVVYKEEKAKIPLIAAATPPLAEVKSSGISKIALSILVLGLVIAPILLAIGLGFAGILAPPDVYAKLVILSAGELILSASILLFFAKK
jgi:uncharacterized protein